MYRITAYLKLLASIIAILISHTHRIGFTMGRSGRKQMPHVSYMAFSALILSGTALVAVFVNSLGLYVNMQTT